MSYTDQMLKYLDNAKERVTMFLTDSTISVMDHVSTAGLDAARSEDAGEDKEDDDEDLLAPDDRFEIEEDVNSDDEQ